MAKLESKFRPELIFEPKHAFAKINEDIYALCWFVDSKNELLYGTETHVKVCDTREYQSHHKGTYEDQTKGQVTSIKFDPFDPRRFAALTEENIKVFDIRNMRRPLVLISGQDSQREDQHEESGQFQGFEWSQTRSNLLVSFMRRSVNF